MERIGTNYGGFYYPKNLPKLNENSIIYCFGAGEDISHDVILSHKLNCKVHIFDPTPRAKEHANYVKDVLRKKKEPETNKNFGGGDPNYWNLILTNPAKSENLIIHDYGLYTENTDINFYLPINKDFVSCSIKQLGRSNDYINVKVKTINTIMEELNHKHIDLLKIDIENIECDVLEKMLNDEIYPMYISVDFDLMNHDKIRCIEVIKKLMSNGYKLIKRTGQDFSFCKKDINITGKYYMEHDQNFIENAKLNFFNYKILDINSVLETEYLFNIIKQGPKDAVVLDIGSFDGDTSIRLSRMLKNIKRDDIKIICFEPNQQHCNKIKLAKEYFTLNIDIVNNIISNKQQTLYMKQDQGAGTMYDSCYKNSVKYDAITIDSINIKNVFLAKIDVEGHEAEVLEGAKNTLKNCNFLYIECWNDEHFKKRHEYKLSGSHNQRILNEINKINQNIYPIQKIEKNILFELKDI